MSRHHLDAWVAAFALILLAQVQRLPLWLSLGAAVAVVTGWTLQRRRRGLGGLWLGVLAVASAAAFWVYYRGQFTVDTAASFLVLTVALKWLELGQRRDLFILFFIQCYLAVVTLLFHQSMLWAAVLLASLFLLFTGLQIALGGGVQGMGREAIKRSALVFVKMLPVVVVLFVFFPRVGPLWSVPLVSEQGMTGLSDSMSPGDITSLVQNDDPAFRVTFGGETPGPDQRYWQALVLDRFDGRGWQRRSVDEREEGVSRVPADAAADSLADDEYEIMLEPHGRRWGFALADSVPASANVTLNHNGMVRFERSVDTRRRYRMRREPQAEASGLSDSARRFYTHLPEDGNERTRDWVSERRAEAGSREALIQQLMEHFNEEPFHYTLQPASLGESNTVDTLMFETREGFCEHYASALGFMLRAADIPARIVTGYLGGESGVDNEYLIVRQYDAHAWVQAWLPGRGWVRLDPTAMIAPERIENGLRDTMGEQGGFLEDNPFSMNRYTDVGWVNWMRLRLDAANYYWQRWVVGYEGQTQLSLLGRLPGDIDRRMLGVITAVLVAVLIMTGVGISVLRSRRRHFRDPWYRLYDQWCRWHERQRTGAGRSDPLSDQVSAAEQAYPSRGRDIRALGALLEGVFYGGDTMEARDLARARRLMNAIRKRKPHG